MHQNPVQAYETAQLQTLHGRALDSYALVRAGKLLQACQDHWDAPEHAQHLQDALAFTQHLWTIFQVELTSEENQLPPDLTQNLLQLSVLIDQGVFDIIADPAPEKLTQLIMINHDIAAGLAAAPEKEQEDLLTIPVQGHVD